MNTKRLSPMKKPHEACDQRTNTRSWCPIRFENHAGICARHSQGSSRTLLRCALHPKALHMFNISSDARQHMSLNSVLLFSKPTNIAPPNRPDNSQGRLPTPLPQTSQACRSKKQSFASVQLRDTSSAKRLINASYSVNRPFLAMFRFPWRSCFFGC